MTGSSDEDLPLRPGDLVAGKYRVESVLGRGGMGAVLLALHERLEERVAIKVLRPELARDAGIARRFEREARAAVRIKSEHVARVRDVGELADGSPFLVMEHLTGSDIGAVLADDGALPLVDTVDLLLQACEALAEAHSHGIVHRDIKPSNLFLTRRADGSPLVKVLDFGIAKAVARDGSSSTLTTTATMLGSPTYMSPEQVRSSRDVDERSDIWSLGVSLFEMLTDSHPFRGASPSAILAAVVMDRPVSLLSQRPGVPPGVVAVVERCLAKDVDARFPDVGHFALALAPFGSPAATKSAERIVGILASRPMDTRSPDTTRRQMGSIPTLAEGSTAPTIPAPPPAQPSAGTDVTVALRTSPNPGVETGQGVTTARKRGERSRGGVIAVALGAVVLALGVGGVMMARTGTPAAPTIASDAHATTQTAAITAASPASAVVTPAAPASPAVTPVSAPSASAPSASARPPSVRPAPRPAPAPGAPKPARPAGNDVDERL